MPIISLMVRENQKMVREMSGKSQGILWGIMAGHPAPDQRWLDSDPNTVTSDRCMIDVDPNIFVFWKLSWMPCKLRDKNQSVQRLSVNILTRWLLDSDIQILLNIGQGNGLLPDDTKSLFKPMFTPQRWSHVMFNWGQYHWARGSWKCSRYQSLPVEYVAKFREEWFI